jgi:hypothetical protein
LVRSLALQLAGFHCRPAAAIRELQGFLVVYRVGEPLVLWAVFNRRIGEADFRLAAGMIQVLPGFLAA